MPNLLGSCVGVLLIAAAVGTARGEEREPAISEGTRDARGILVHTVESPYQAGTTKIRVLRPTTGTERERFPVIYVLPVEARDESRYGDGLGEVARLGLHDSLRAIFVSPTFSHLPWYGDHPTDRAIRQESHFLKVVTPFIEAHYPVQEGREGRRLLGFSKSGWGAWSLLLRHPDLFEKAAAWDAPLMMERPGAYGSGAIFGTPENFEDHRITGLLKRRAAEIGARDGSPVRLFLLGYDSFRDHHVQAHALMVSLKIPHVERDGPKRPHTWEGGWLREAAEFLADVPGRAD